ncbi:hypothetical protein Q4I30_005802 [Leishmania utingensis]|uniref:Uncharacterized protein n=1 Tax=Leishmania utingensis TaxID=653362 RepID=A0AAW3A6D9_9TRYP
MRLGTTLGEQLATRTQYTFMSVSFNHDQQTVQVCRELLRRLSQSTPTPMGYDGCGRHGAHCGSNLLLALAGMCSAAHGRH